MKLPRRFRLPTARDCRRELYTMTMQGELPPDTARAATGALRAVVESMNRSATYPGAAKAMHLGLMIQVGDWGGNAGRG